MEPLLTTEDVAEWLRMDVATIRRLAGRGELPAYRVGGEYRFKRPELETFLDSQRVGVIGPGWMPRIEFAVGKSGEERGNRMTGRARKVLQAAKSEAELLGRPVITPEHLLLALIQESSGVGAGVLSNMGVQIGPVREMVEADGRGDDRPGGLALETSRILELAVGEARRMGHSYLGTEHLVLGLVAEGPCPGSRFLAEQGITLDRARAEVTRVLSQK